MLEMIEQYESIIRLGFFVGILSDLQIGVNGTTVEIYNRTLGEALIIGTTEFLRSVSIAVFACLICLSESNTSALNST